MTHGQEENFTHDLSLSVPFPYSLISSQACVFAHVPSPPSEGPNILFYELKQLVMSTWNAVLRRILKPNVDWGWGKRRGVA